MEKQKEEEVYEDCIEEKRDEVNPKPEAQNKAQTEENTENKIDTDNKKEEEDNKDKKQEEEQQQKKPEEENKEDEENTNNRKEHIPFTIKQSQEKKAKNDDNEEEDDDNEEKVVLTEQEKKDIEEKIINERKNAGELYKNQEYIQALNIYSLLLKDAKRAELNEQCCILNCNKGICFNKLKDYDKALDSFKEALKYNKDYSKALCNKMLLLNKKEDYMEAYEDFKRLKTLDYNLWENYRNMENGLAYQAEIQKKKMTNEMLGKLKDMGNSILGKFGMSLDNFQMTPNGQGGYSIQYNNNKK